MVPGGGLNSAAQSPGDSDKSALKQKQVDCEEEEEEEEEEAPALSSSSQAGSSSQSHHSSQQFPGGPSQEAGEELASPSPELSLGPTAAGTVAVNTGASSSARAAGRKRYVGVRQRPSGRWVAEIKDTTHKIRLWLGTFNNPEDAARAYDDAARTLRGANTRTNFARAAGTRPGFSSNSVRLLLQKAVEAAAVAGNLDSGGVLPSVAAAAGGPGGSEPSASFTAPTQHGAAESGPSSNFRTGLHSDSELEQHMRQQQQQQASNLFAAGAAEPSSRQHQGMLRSVSYDHATMMRSLGQAAGAGPNLRLYNSFSGDFGGSETATSGSFDLQQQMQQISNAGPGPGGATYGSSAASGYEHPLDQADMVDHGSNSYQSQQYSIYESLREKLGRGVASQLGLTAPLNTPRESSTDTFAEQGAGPVGNMGVGWNSDPSSLTSDVNLSQWGRSNMPGLGVHGIGSEPPPPTGTAAAGQGSSWEHGNVRSRDVHDEPGFGLEEIPSVNWGNLGRSAVPGDGAERMDTIDSLNWEDLGRTSEQRNMERLTTINWGDLIDRTAAAGEARGMEGINSWGNMEQGQYSSSRFSRPLWQSGDGHNQSHESFSASQEYWEPGAAQPQLPTMGLMQVSPEQQQTQNTSKSSTTASDSSQQWSTECQSPRQQQIWSSKRADSATNLPPGLEVGGGVLRAHSTSGSARASYEGDVWATSSSQAPYTQNSFAHSVMRAPPSELLPNVQQQLNPGLMSAISHRSVSKQDSARDNSSGGDRAGVMDYSSSDPTNPDALNFLLSSPGFFRMDSFPRGESSPSTIATGDANHHHLFGGAQTDNSAPEQDDSVAMEARQDSRMVPPESATMQPRIQETNSGPVRPQLHRNNAACLVDIMRDGVDDREQSPTRSHMLGEAVRSHLILDGTVISTKDLLSATRPTSDLDVNRASD